VPVGLVIAASGQRVWFYYGPAIRPSSGKPFAQSIATAIKPWCGDELPANLHLCLCRPRTFALFIRTSTPAVGRGFLKVHRRATLRDPHDPQRTRLLARCSRPGMLLSVLLLATFAAAPPPGG